MKNVFSLLDANRGDYRKRQTKFEELSWFRCDICKATCFNHSVRKWHTWFLPILKLNYKIRTSQNSPQHFHRFANTPDWTKKRDEKKSNLKQFFRIRLAMPWTFPKLMKFLHQVYIQKCSVSLLQDSANSIPQVVFFSKLIWNFFCFRLLVRREC